MRPFCWAPSDHQVEVGTGVDLFKLIHWCSSLLQLCLCGLAWVYSLFSFCFEKRAQTRAISERERNSNKQNEGARNHQNKNSFCQMMNVFLQQAGQEPEGATEFLKGRRPESCFSPLPATPPPCTAMIPPPMTKYGNNPRLMPT